MNHKIAEACDIFIHCEVIFEMRTADLEKVSFYSCVENVEMKVTDIIFTLSIFVAKRIENELILKYLWKWAVETNTFSWADESVEWIIHSFEKKIVFLNYLFETTSLCAEKNVFSATLN